jgi:hypothetical protein
LTYYLLLTNVATSVNLEFKMGLNRKIGPIQERKLTTQRLLILEVLQEFVGHIEAKELYWIL